MLVRRVASALRVPPGQAVWSRWCSGAQAGVSGLPGEAAGLGGADPADAKEPPRAAAAHAAAVVKVWTTHSNPNYQLPWQNRPQHESSGSGFVLSSPLLPGGRGVLTNAHVVADQSFVMVRRHGQSEKYEADVAAVGHECDLAVLHVKDPGFWEQSPPYAPLGLGGVPQLQEQVSVVGFPQGGETLSITSGVVSRVEMIEYAHGANGLLAVQIDAAINPGNSGGPAIGAGGEVAGIAFQNLPGADSIGYLIPPPVIDHFLSDVHNFGERRHAGFCALGIMYQTMENAHLRSYYKMPPGLTGVLVSKIGDSCPAAGHMKPGDVLLKVDGLEVANDGTVKYRGDERIELAYVTSMKRRGDPLSVEVWREGERHAAEVVTHPLQYLVPVHRYDMLPSYFVYAGIVFCPLTQPHLLEYGDDWYNTAPRRLVDRAMKYETKSGDEEVVIIACVLADAVNVGYQWMSDLEVLRVDGEKVRNLRHLRELVEGSEGAGGYIRIDIEQDKVVVIDRAAAKEAQARILAKHRVHQQMSDCLG